jgi:hypothetical protein
MEHGLVPHAKRRLRRQESAAPTTISAYTRFMYITRINARTEEDAQEEEEQDVGTWAQLDWKSRANDWGLHGYY